MGNRLNFLGIHAEPSNRMGMLVGLLPLVVLICAYLTVSYYRLHANPRDKLTPSPGRMIEATKTMAFTKDERTGTYLMLSDTVSSVKRIAMGLGSAALVGLVAGINMGMLPGIGATFLPIVTFFSIIPPLAILPILFILFGVGELGKVMLIFLGAVFIITRDMYYTSRTIPREQIVKALTLGASQFEVVYQVVLPQIMPRLLVAVRLSLGAAWLFLIASEAIASTDGLGYRIFLVRRYLAMDVIIPYVLWITCLGFLMDSVLRLLVSWRYPWFEAAGK
jgi:NitT/TauT family transport system permease protein